MKALITGADGFIGSHLTELLLKKNISVVALAQYNSFNNWGWLEDIPSQDNLDIVTGDIRDSNYCRQVCSGVDIVFHLAALIAIPYSYKSQESFIDTNVKGTLNMCRAALDSGVKRFLHTSTSEVYGTAQYVPIDEKHPLQPQSPYSASKIGADAIAMSFYHAFGLNVSVARPFNTYGPRQSARAVIPTIITQIASGAREIKLGDVFPTRDFSFVEDTCRGIYELANCTEAIGKTVNIGSNTEISIEDVFNLIRDLMHSEAVLVHDRQRTRPENSEVYRLWCDNGLISKLTGYTPSYTIKVGLQNTIDWYSKPENLSKYKTGIYNI
jgi:NAD dependent epimerase/dehydratase